MNHGKHTLGVIRALHQDGIRNIAAVIRHSIRNHDRDIRKEPFMCLTEPGKHSAAAFGEALPAGRSIRLFSSYIGRCIETAYLIDKGYTRKGGQTADPMITPDLSPFYVRDLKKTIQVIVELDLSTFIRNWLDGTIDDSVLMPARNAAQQMFTGIAGGLLAREQDTLDICVSHDWNIFLLKELGLGLPHERCGHIDYLEGVVLFEDRGEVFVTSHQAEPRPLPPEYRSN